MPKTTSPKKKRRAESRARETKRQQVLAKQGVNIEEQRARGMLFDVAGKGVSRAKLSRTEAQFSNFSAVYGGGETSIEEDAESFRLLCQLFEDKRRPYPDGDRGFFGLSILQGKHQMIQCDRYPVKLEFWTLRDFVNYVRANTEIF